MSIKITPVGTKLLVLPLPKEENTFEAGIIAVDFALDKGEVLEVPEYLKNIYKKGDVVLYPQSTGITYFYDKKHCLFLNGQEYPQGDIWAIVTNDIPKKDKQDSL